MKKYTKKEKVIELLKSGFEMYRTRNESFGKQGQTVYLSRCWEISDGTSTNYAHHSTIQSLMDNGIIMKEKPYSLIN